MQGLVQRLQRLALAEFGYPGKQLERAALPEHRRGREQGTALLGLNASVRKLAGPLELLSVVLLGASIVLVSRTLTAGCQQPRSSIANDQAAEHGLGARVAS